jgi:retron-type reverse transcriptase
LAKNKKKRLKPPILNLNLAIFGFFEVKSPVMNFSRSYFCLMQSPNLGAINKLAVNSHRACLNTFNYTQCFERHLEDNIFQLHEDLVTSRYQHGPYSQFHVFDPKERHISKASVRDRLVHQLIYSALTKIWDKKFIFHSFSCRQRKGTHLGITHLQRMMRKVSSNGKKSCFALKMDIRRFFDAMDHRILKQLIRKHISEQKILNLIEFIIDSFQVGLSSKGLPLGNVTSQLFANIYLHELDHFVKHVLRFHYYLRYCDDFILL